MIIIRNSLVMADKQNVYMVILLGHCC